MAFRRQLDFKKNVSRALNDTQLRDNLRSAMGSLILKRKAVFPDEAGTDYLRDQAHAIKKRALSMLPELLDQLESGGVLVMPVAFDAFTDELKLVKKEEHGFMERDLMKCRFVKLIGEQGYEK